MTDTRAPAIVSLERLRASLVDVGLELPVEGVPAQRAAAEAAVRQIDDYIRPRLADLDAPLLVVVGGSTGSGKSTLVNAMIGAPTIRVGVIRPTTRQPILVHAPVDAGWFASDRILPGLARVRGTITAPGIHATAAGDAPAANRITELMLLGHDRVPTSLAMIDAPDIDSVADENRALAGQLLAAADLWLFVTTANRYADAVPWRVLEDAASRSVTVGVVLNRVPPGAAADVLPDLQAMLAARGLEGTPVFTVDEQALDALGMLPQSAIAEPLAWLTAIAGDRFERTRIAARTLGGTIADLDRRVAAIADARQEQLDWIDRTEAMVAAAYDAAVEAVDDATRDGALLRGEVLARWQDFVGTSDVFRSIESWFSRARDSVTAFFAGRPAPVVEVETQIESGLHAVIVDQGGRTASAVWAELQRSAAGRMVADGDPALASESPGFADAAAATIRDWQGSLLKLVQDNAGSKRVRARVLSLGLNVVTVALMVVVFASTDELAAEIDALDARAGQRRGRSPGSTVVGLFGATGSGKSSLLNALVGDEVARTHVRRPTTSQALAVTWQAEGGAELLDWLDVRDRVVRERPLDPRAGQLVLLDLPDFDSVETANRAIAERLATQVDALLWVVDPQKYADDVLHAQFIAPHARHAEVTLLVLNQIDLLTPADVTAVVRSLQEIARRDGIPKARVVPVSARTGDGIPALRAALGDLAAARSVRDARLAADAATLAERMPPAGAATSVATRDLARLGADVARAAGIDTVADAVAGSYRKRSAQATGWPIVSWIARLRADPLRRLGLGIRGRDRDPAVHRTSMPQPSSGAQARLSLAVRGYADAASAELTPPWRAGVRAAGDRALAALPDALDLAIGGTTLPSRGSWWWPVFAIVQWIAVLAGLVGAGWLLAAALLPTQGFPAPPIPRVEGWAVPTLLIVGAVLLGILLGLFGAALAALAGAARRATTRRRLTAATDEVVRRLVVDPIDAELLRVRAYTSARAIAGA